MARPDVRTIRNVELLKVGVYDISNRRGWTVTKPMLASILSAFRDGGVRRPPLKLGHVDDEVGQPSIGWIDGLRLMDGGATLVGDYVGVPGPLAANLKSLFPTRSVEVADNWTAPNGRMFPAFLSAVALLGAEDPGVPTLRSLNEVAALYDGGASRVPAMASASRLRLVKASAAVPTELTTAQRVQLRAAASRRRSRRAASILHTMEGN
ncbi:hypothetical protein CH282_26175 [Rhodococcus sp. 06-418-1B]|nr:hypothetical protein [Rhodococcus sp. 06-418-1B]OZC76367.1 hypothetical protein CH282_26175 [Rhodococcus sp. 06-418-1B]